MNNFWPALFYSLLLLVITSCSDDPRSERGQETSPETLGYIELLDNELENVLNTDAKPEIIGEGFEWSEGPVWVAEHGFLLFSDVPANTIYRWTEESGVEAYLEPSGYTGSSDRGGEIGSNGLIIGNDGELFLCQHGDRRIARMDAPLNEPSPEFSTVADNYDGQKFNSPNDLIQHSNESIYFTDPPYGLEGYVDDPAREMEIQGVFRADPDGSVTLLTDDLSRPNGLAFSPDESLLYVANSDNNRSIWMVYDVMETGDIENGSLFYDTTEYVGLEPGLPDGMKVRSDGYIFATGPGGVWIFTPDARPLGQIKTGEFISNLAFDETEETIYMTANNYLLRLRL